jgi:replication factor A1
MKINELKLGMNDISLKAKVTEVSEPRNVKTRYGYDTKVADAMIEDDTGKIKLTLWGKQTEDIGEGDTLEIKGGYVSEFMGEIQLNVPRKGELNKVS